MKPLKKPAQTGGSRDRLARPRAIDFSRLSLTELRLMSAAGRDIRECYRVLANTGDNIVGEVLRGQGTFREWEHYPPDDVYDAASHAQFYYHAHPAGGRGWSEHGHFHTFLGVDGIPPDVTPADIPPPADQPELAPAQGCAANAALCHLVAIAMNPIGLPVRLFTTNRWVTGDTWFLASDVCAMLDFFVVDHTRPSWALNRWISAMFRLFKPQIAELLHARDRTIAAWQPRSGKSVYDDRSLEVTSALAINIDRQIAQVETALARIA